MSKIKSSIKIKPNEYADGDIVKVNFMFIHPMETGLRKDKATGELIPADYINNVKFIYNGETITTMNVWESLSTNPAFTTYMKINGAGDLKVIFTDNSGSINEKSIKIKPKG
ncbi:MAG: thiosulfate oxidation carrier complex protein SoxZ [Sulfurimonadaceae bacterium]|jgi:sulfur-oxidizing protein SoxZ|nr:thiosulfate oxidation carrier complex protein SoxZ [Sulfurimonadaceae bacterium]